MTNKRTLILMVIISSCLAVVNQLGTQNGMFYLVFQSITLACAISLWRLTAPDAIVINSHSNSHSNSDEHENFRKCEVDDKTIQSVIFQLQQFLHQEVIVVENEIQRTILLVEEAVIGLSQSFKSLQGLSNEQQQMIQLIMKSKTAVVNVNEAGSLSDFIEDVNLRLESFVEIINSSKKNFEELSYTDEITNKFEHVIGLLAEIKSKKNRDSSIEDVTCNQELTNEFNEAKVVIDELINITPKITDAVFLGVRSLQFEDLTRQSLQSLKRNVASIHSISDVLVQFNESCEGAVHQHLVNLKNKCEEAYLKTKTEEEKRSVKQLSMEEGEVDLF